MALSKETCTNSDTPAPQKYLFQLDNFSYNQVRGIFTDGVVERRLRACARPLFDFYLQNINREMTKDYIKELNGSSMTTSQVEVYTHFIRRAFPMDSVDSKIVLSQNGGRYTLNNSSELKKHPVDKHGDIILVHPEDHDRDISTSFQRGLDTYPAKIELTYPKPVKRSLEVDTPTILFESEHSHIWVLDDQDGVMAGAKCRLCGTTREFPNSFDNVKKEKALRHYSRNTILYKTDET